MKKIGIIGGGFAETMTAIPQAPLLINSSNGIPSINSVK
jgi:hypothetical protein